MVLKQPTTVNETNLRNILAQSPEHEAVDTTTNAPLERQNGSMRCNGVRSDSSAELNISLHKANKAAFT